MKQCERRANFRRREGKGGEQASLLGKWLSRELESSKARVTARFTVLPPSLPISPPQLLPDSPLLCAPQSSLRRPPSSLTYAKELLQIVVLAVNVTANRNGARHFRDVLLVVEDILGHLALGGEDESRANTKREQRTREDKFMWKLCEWK